MTDLSTSFFWKFGSLKFLPMAFLNDDDAGHFPDTFTGRTLISEHNTCKDPPIKGFLMYKL